MLVLCYNGRVTATLYNQRLKGQFDAVDPGRFVNMDQAKRILDRSDVVIWRRRNRGDLRAFKYGHRVFFLRDEIERMAREQEWLYGQNETVKARFRTRGDGI